MTLHARVVRKHFSALRGAFRRGFDRNGIGENGWCSGVHLIVIILLHYDSVMFLGWKLIFPSHQIAI